MSRRSEDRSWHVAVTFVLLTLVTLVVVPLLVQRRVHELRREIAAAEPARTRAIQVQFNLVGEMIAVRDLALSGDTADTDRYRAARAAEQAAFDDLSTRAAALGPDVLEAVVAARTLADQWHARFEDGAGPSSFEEVGRALPGDRERQLFDQVVTATLAIDSAIVQETSRNRARIAAVERTGVMLMLASGVLALVAAAAVIALHARARRFAAEAEMRRAEADEALAVSALAAEARARLLRGIAHDVKNPLGAARGYAELLAMQIKGPLGPEQVPLVAGVERSIDSALEIIADLLDVARADSGGIQVARVPVELDALARGAVEDHRAAAQAAGHTIDLETGVAPLIVHTDPARVRQVLDNLISNALKYTPAPGRIVVRAVAGENDGAPRPGTWATLTVTDTGPGIPAEMREAVFDEFTRLEEGGALKGHGLGLAIARRFARLLGGELEVADAGPGATLVLWLPQRSNA